MNRLIAIPALAVAAIALAAPAMAAQKNGETAQDFKLTNAYGKTVQLSDFRGKTVVLEWHNPGCPFVRKHYDSGNMQKTQAAAKGQGAVWLTINSGAPGKQGHQTVASAQKLVKAEKSRADHYLLDMNGVVGRAYAAKTTPHMYIIDAKGTLVYQGGIDNKPTANAADIPGARNHVLAALNDLQAGTSVQVARSRPYGCSVKYKG